MKVQALFRYPVKSMQGESLDEATVTTAGLVGDRVLALQDRETDTIVSAKHPQRWNQVRHMAATWSPEGVSITLPNGEQTSEHDPRASQVLSATVGRDVRLLRTPPEGAMMYRTWPAVPDIAPDSVRRAAHEVEDGVTVGPLGVLAPGTFFDAAPVHVVFASSLRRLAELSGEECDLRRFRPNICINDEALGHRALEGEGFVESSLIGAELTIGGAVLRLDLPTPRCIVPTLPVAGLAQNLELLRTLAKCHRIDVGGLGRFACFGAYASVVQGGVIRRGDPVRAKLHGTGV